MMTEINNRVSHQSYKDAGTTGITTEHEREITANITETLTDHRQTTHANRYDSTRTQSKQTASHSAEITETTTDHAHFDTENTESTATSRTTSTTTSVEYNSVSSTQKQLSTIRTETTVHVNNATEGIIPSTLTATNTTADHADFNTESSSLESTVTSPTTRPATSVEYNSVSSTQKLQLSSVRPETTLHVNNATEKIILITLNANNTTEPTEAQSEFRPTTTVNDTTTTEPTLAVIESSTSAIRSGNSLVTNSEYENKTASISSPETETTDVIMKKATTTTNRPTPSVHSEATTVQTITTLQIPNEAATTSEISDVDSEVSTGLKSTTTSVISGIPAYLTSRPTISNSTAIRLELSTTETVSSTSETSVVHSGVSTMKKVATTSDIGIPSVHPAVSTNEIARSSVSPSVQRDTTTYKMIEITDDISDIITNLPEVEMNSTTSVTPHVQQEMSTAEVTTTMPAITSIQPGVISAETTTTNSVRAQQVMTSRPTEMTTEFTDMRSVLDVSSKMTTVSAVMSTDNMTSTALGVLSEVTTAADMTTLVTGMPGAEVTTTKTSTTPNAFSKTTTSSEKSTISTELTTVRQESDFPIELTSVRQESDIPTELTTVRQQSDIPTELTTVRQESTAMSPKERTTTSSIADTFPEMASVSKIATMTTRLSTSDVTTETSVLPELYVTTVKPSKSNVSDSTVKSSFHGTLTNTATSSTTFPYLSSSDDIKSSTVHYSGTVIESSQATTTADGGYDTALSTSVTNVSNNESTIITSAIRSTSESEDIRHSGSTFNPVSITEDSMTDATISSNTSMTQVRSGTQPSAVQSLNITSEDTYFASIRSTTANPANVSAEYLIHNSTVDGTSKLITSLSQPPVSQDQTSVASFTAETFSSSTTTENNITSENVTAKFIPENVTLSEIDEVNATAEQTTFPDLSSYTGDYATINYTMVQSTSSKAPSDIQHSTHSTTPFVLPTAEIIQNGTTTSSGILYVSVGQNTDALNTATTSTEEPVHNKTSSVVTDIYRGSSSFTTAYERKSASSETGLKATSEDSSTRVQTTEQVAAATTADSHQISDAADAETTTSSTYSHHPTTAATKSTTHDGSTSRSSTTRLHLNVTKTVSDILTSLLLGSTATEAAVEATTVQDSLKTTDKIVSPVNTLGLPIKFTSTESSTVQTSSTTLRPSVASSSSSASYPVGNTTSRILQRSTQTAVTLTSSSIDKRSTSDTAVRRTSGGSSIAVTTDVSLTTSTHPLMKNLDNHTSSQRETSVNEDTVSQTSEDVVIEYPTGTSSVVQPTTTSVSTTTISSRSSPKPGNHIDSKLHAIQLMQLAAATMPVVRYIRTRPAWFQENLTPIDVHDKLDGGYSIEVQTHTVHSIAFDYVLHL